MNLQQTLSCIDVVSLAPSSQIDTICSRYDLSMPAALVMNQGDRAVEQQVLSDVCAQAKERVSFVSSC